jgi:hypothetical protein
VDTDLSNRRSAVCHLPIWIYGYRYQNTEYRVLVNGHTGEIVGDRPVSRARVAFAIAIGVLVLVVIIALFILFS